MIKGIFAVWKIEVREKGSGTDTIAALGQHDQHAAILHKACGIFNGLMCLDEIDVLGETPGRGQNHRVSTIDPAAEKAIVFLAGFDKLRIGAAALKGGDPTVTVEQSVERAIRRHQGMHFLQVFGYGVAPGLSDSASLCQFPGGRIEKQPVVMGDGFTFAQPGEQEFAASSIPGKVVMGDGANSDD